MTPVQTNKSQPRPSQRAIEPASSKDLWQGLGVIVLCFIGFGLGLWAWFDVAVAEMLFQSVGQSQSSGWWLMLAFPIFFPGAIYFIYTTWRHWRDTRRFERSKQTTAGVISHLWIDPPRPPGKRYYVGYQFGSGHSAYQEIHVRTHSRLTVGEPVTVEYSQTHPHLSRLNLPKRVKKQ